MLLEPAAVDGARRIDMRGVTAERHGGGEVRVSHGLFDLVGERCAGVVG